MKILVTGSRGMLGTDLMQILDSHNTVGLDKDRLDITDLSAVMDIARELKPQVIINAAAYTNVDGCETEQALAYALNADGPGNLAKAAREIGATLLHVSTDYVFDGTKGSAYIESDLPNPQGIYGKSKLQGEINVRETWDRHYIVRTQWLYGQNGNNFVKTICKLARERGELKVVDDQVGCPTFTRDLAQAIKELIETGIYGFETFGTYHITNSGQASWYEFTKEILRLTNLEVKLTPCTTAEFPRPAKRPSFAPLENKKWADTSHKPLRHYKEALAEYMK